MDRPPHTSRSSLRSPPESKRAWRLTARVSQPTLSRPAEAIDARSSSVSARDNAVRALRAALLLGTA
ncbi:hypothetical protein EVAR_79547_1 [Eumeta japonica]|uniref:Uncharacterized protein n=1 Tax=Eumeta variegata TaxID=151549 RepID=A0A4C1Y9X7_EUMVA|nr:hypothetical protein EVAR_79547_1 [Eumeta japonica]